MDDTKGWKGRTCGNCGYFDPARSECNWMVPPAMISLARSIMASVGEAIDHESSLDGPFMTTKDSWCSGWEAAES